MKLTKEELIKHKKQMKKRNKEWTDEEKELLKQLLDHDITNVLYIIQQKFFPGRTENSIRYQIRNLKGNK